MFINIKNVEQGTCHRNAQTTCRLSTHCVKIKRWSILYDIILKACKGREMRRIHSHAYSSCLARYNLIAWPMLT